jgi:hypothetical protein
MRNIRGDKRRGLIEADDVADCLAAENLHPRRQTPRPHWSGQAGAYLSAIHAHIRGAKCCGLIKPASLVAVYLTGAASVFAASSAMGSRPSVVLAM